MIQTNIKNLFEEVGLENIRPTDEALAQMGMSRRRFTFLVENLHKTSITYDEVEAIKTWVERIKTLDPEAMIETQSDSSGIAKEFGLTK